LSIKKTANNDYEEVIMIWSFDENEEDKAYKCDKKLAKILKEIAAGDTGDGYNSQIGDVIERLEELHVIRRVDAPETKVITVKTWQD
jgi:hypothetical protein